MGTDENRQEGKVRQLTEFQKALEPVVHRMLRSWRKHDWILDKMIMKQGIYKSQWKVLCYVHHHEGVSQRELAQHFEISPPSIAVTAKRLEKMGYLSRQMDEKDNRLNILKTTEAGREILNRTWEVFTGVDAQMFAGFSLAELSVLQGFYERMEENLDRINEATEKE